MAFKLRSDGSSFKQMGATSPMKTGAVIAGGKKAWQGVNWLTNKIWNPKVIAGAGAVETQIDNTPERSNAEKFVRGVDDWGPTMGVLSNIADNAERNKGTRISVNPVTSPVGTGGNSYNKKFNVEDAIGERGMFYKPK